MIPYTTQVSIHLYNMNLKTAEKQRASSSTLNITNKLISNLHFINASKGKEIVMFLDYDGTLSPIVEDPEQAFMTPEMKETVRDVAKYFRTVIVSGRSRAKVINFVQLSELYYAGSHGMDIEGPSEGGNQAVLCQPAKEYLPMIDEVIYFLRRFVEWKTSSIERYVSMCHRED